MNGFMALECAVVVLHQPGDDPIQAAWSKLNRALTKEWAICARALESEVLLEWVGHVFCLLAVFARRVSISGERRNRHR
jgi:hypothetical protein